MYPAYQQTDTGMKTVVADREQVRVLHPGTAAEAVSLAGEHGGTYIAGATWLQPSCERSQTWPSRMVALNPGWPGFQGLHESSDGLTIGALTTLAAFARDPLTASYLPCLTGRNGLMNQVAGPGVRRLGTVGGNLIAGGDLSALALALDARIQLLCQQGTRELNMADFYPVLASTDLIKSVTFPDCRGWRIAVEKLGHRERFSPTRATVACVCDGTQVRMAVCGEGGPARLTLSEAVLRDTSCKSPTALAQTLDDELERLGWLDSGLRLAIRRMLGYLRQEVVSG